MNMIYFYLILITTRSALLTREQISEFYKQKAHLFGGPLFVSKPMLGHQR